ncbi:MAG: EAL domain-containing protein [Candidatus Enteromonas sp.]|nr:EAL domain-containing protein [Candidatus Enteromonas sp.]
MAKHKIERFAGNKHSRLETLRETLRAGAIARRQLLFLIFSLVLFLLLSAATLVLYSFSLSPWYYVTGAACFLYVIVLLVLIPFSFAKIVSSRNKIATSLIDQMESFRYGEIRTVNTRWPLESYNHIQAKLNEVIAYYSSLISSSKSQEGKRAGTKEVIPWHEFLSKIPEEVSWNPSHQSAVLIFRLYGEASPTPKAKEVLKEALRKEFPNDLMASAENGGFALFVYCVESKTSFEGRLAHIVADFSYCETSSQTGDLSAFGIRVGGAYYPGMDATSLPFAANRACNRSQGVLMDSGKEISFLSPWSGNNLSETSERVEALALEEEFLRLTSRCSDAGQQKNILEQTFDSMRRICGFEEGALYLYSPTLRRYSLFLSSQEENSPSFFLRLGKVVEESVFEGFLELSKKEAPLFSGDIASLPPNVSSTLSSLGVVSFYLFPIVENNQTRGLLFFSSSRFFELRLFARERLQTYLPYLKSEALSSSQKMASAYILSAYNSLSSRKEIYSYSIDRNSFRLLSCSDNLLQKKKGISFGVPCHQTLYGLESPCENCPLLNGAGSRNIPFLGSKPFTQSVLAFQEGEEGIATIMVEKEDERAFGASLIDKSLNIKTSRAFQIDLNREMRLSLTQGYYLGIHLNNRETLLRELPSQSINSLMAAISREIAAVGYDESAYRFDAETFAIHFPGLSNRTLLFVAIETIADAICRPLYCGEDSFTPIFSFALVGYPSDATTPGDLTSLLASELRRSSKLGNGLVAEVGKAKARKALRQDYIHSILESTLKQNKIDLLFTPILNSSNGKLAILKASPILYEEGRKQIRDAEFLKIAKLFRMQEMLDLSFARSFLTYYQEHLEGKVSVSYLLLPLSPETICVQGGKEKLMALKKEVHIPDHFLLLCFGTPSIARAPESFAEASSFLHQGGIEILADRYSPDSFPLKRLSELGVDGIIASPYFLQEALSSESDRLLYGSYVKDAKNFGLIEFASGIENEDGKKFVQGLKIPFYHGPYFGERMEASELATYLNYQK